MVTQIRTAECKYCGREEDYRELLFNNGACERCHKVRVVAETEKFLNLEIEEAAKKLSEQEKRKTNQRQNESQMRNWRKKN